MFVFVFFKSNCSNFSHEVHRSLTLACC